MQTTSHYPLTPHEMVTDDLLRQFADPARKSHIITDEEAAQLVMILPDLCGELLGRRRLMAAMDDAPHVPGTHADAIAAALAGDDPDPVERAESLAQFNADELAEHDARLSDLEEKIDTILESIGMEAA